jgi:DNA-binding transcriptional regulator YhcF (GntR family)
VNEATKLAKAIEKAQKSGMSISAILAIIEKIYVGQFRSFVWRSRG